eukprot:3382734-Amphidinium_carterae.1
MAGTLTQPYNGEAARGTSSRPTQIAVATSKNWPSVSWQAHQKGLEFDIYELQRRLTVETASARK